MFSAQFELIVCYWIFDLLPEVLHRCFVLRVIQDSFVHDDLICIEYLSLVDLAKNGVLDQPRQLKLLMTFRLHQIWHPLTNHLLSR